MRPLFLVWALCLSGCPGGTGGGTVDAGPGDPCGLAFLGDPAAELRFTPTALGPTLASGPLTNGSTVSLVMPPQGGRVALIGVRDATHLDPCGVSLLAAVKDPASRRLQLDARILNLPPGDNGLGASIDLDISTFANVPLCPNQWASADLFDQDYELTLTLTDRTGRSATRTLTLRPACDVPGEVEACRCLCKKDYKLGDVCVDGPSGDGGT